jgi:hypothetical protein
MPICYAVTRPVKISSLGRKLRSASENTVFEPVKYVYKDLIDIINKDKDFELFATLEEAERCCRVEKRLEPGTTAGLTVALIDAEPIRIGTQLLSGVLHGPTPTKYQRMLLKIYIFDADVANQSSIAALHFERYWADNTNIMARISKDHALFLDTITFQGKTWCQEQPYPDSYTEIFYREVYLDKNNYLIRGVNTLIKDYYAPNGGWFLTGHWNRHHKEMAQALHQQILTGGTFDKTLSHLVEVRKQLLEMNCNKSGSFFRRVNYAIELLVSHQEMAAPSVSLSHAMSM